MNILNISAMLSAIQMADKLDYRKTSAMQQVGRVKGKGAFTKGKRSRSLMIRSNRRKAKRKINVK